MFLPRRFLVPGMGVCLLAAASGASLTSAAEPTDAGLALADRHAFAEQVAAGATSDLERARALTTWFARHFDWTATDYQQRTVDEILERQGGNCAELARVTTAMFEELGMRMRSVREINLHVESASRRETARAKIAELGNRASVFGKRHNDHVWIEIQDRATGEWFPADPSLGVVGEEAWIAARLGFGERFTLDPSSEDMIAPFAIFAWQDGRMVENRTAHYSVEGFDRFYDGRLSALPAWSEWVRLLDELDDRALAAFRGEANLHDSEARIDELAQTYERLREELAVSNGFRQVY
jgi:Transglutaminase-like superfamily